MKSVLANLDIQSSGWKTLYLESIKSNTYMSLASIARILGNIGDLGRVLLKLRNISTLTAS